MLHREAVRGKSRVSHVPREGRAVQEASMCKGTGVRLRTDPKKLPGGE